MEVDPTRVCELLVGLGDVEVLGVDDDEGGPLRVHVRRRAPRPGCDGCGGALWSDGERPVVLVDLPAFGRPVRLVWHKRRWRCPLRACGAGTVTEQDPAIAPPREKLTTRAGRWATRQAGRARPVGEVAAELGCSWHRVNASVRCWGSALLDADTGRISDVFALGLDETLMGRRGRFRAKAWSTSIVDVGAGQLLDIVPGRTADGPARWLMRRPAAWRDQIRWAVLDLSGPYRAAFDTAIPDAAQVADPFHVVRLGNTALDEVRRRVQNQTLGHRGHKHDPLYRARKLLVSASENINDHGRVRLRGLLDAGDPYGEVRDAWHAKETLRAIYDITDPDLGAATVAQLASDLQDSAMPTEINRLGRTIWRWRTQIASWHAARVTNAATEAANNLIKRVKRAAFGFTNFATLPHPRPALRRQTQLGTPRHPHPDLERGEPHYITASHIEHWADSDGQVTVVCLYEPPWLSWRVGLLVSNRCVVGSSGSVGRLELCWRDISEVGVKALVVVPVHPSQCGQLDVGGAVPGSLVGSADQLGLVEADDALSQGVVIGVAH